MAAPSRPATNSDSRNAGWFCPSHATRSPFATPSARRALANRRSRSASSESVHERSPATRATPLGATPARRSIHEPMPTFPSAVLTVIPNAFHAAKLPARAAVRSAFDPYLSDLRFASLGPL